MKGLKFKLSRHTLEILYKSLVRSNMEYADVVWDGCTLGERDLLENLQYEAARVVTGAMKGTHRENVLNDVAWHKLQHRRAIHKWILIYKIINKLTPNYLNDLCLSYVSQHTNYNLRTSNDLNLPAPRTERFKNSFLYSTISSWNSLPMSIRSSLSLASFKKKLLHQRFSIPTLNQLVYVGDHYPAILHTRLRLGNSALNHDLFLKNCVPSPACKCGAQRETKDVIFFFYVPDLLPFVLNCLPLLCRLPVMPGLTRLYRTKLTGS